MLEEPPPAAPTPTATALTSRRRPSGLAGPLRNLDRLLPDLAARSGESFALRVLQGANLLAIVAAAPALVVAALSGQRHGVLFIGGFALAQVAQMVALRLGAPLRVLLWAEFTAVGLFLTLQSLSSSVFEPAQLKWLVALPLAAMVLSHSADGAGVTRGGPSPWVAAVMSLVLGGFIVEAHRLGLTFGDPPTPLRRVDALVDFASFVLAVAGMLHLAARSAQATRAELEALRRLLSVCSWCRRIRDRAEWHPIEDYVAQHYADLTHGICPDCASRHFPEVPLDARIP